MSRVGGGAASQTAPHWVAVGSLQGLRWHKPLPPGQASCDLPLETSLAKSVRLGSSVGGVVGTWLGSCELHSGSPARTTLAGGNSFYRVWLSHVVLEFSNAPCNWLPRPSHPAPGPDWPRGAPVILLAAPQRGWGCSGGGVVTGPPVWWWLKPPWPRRIGRELGAELWAEALQKGPHPQPSCQLCPIPGPAPAEDRALRRQSPRLSHEK